MVDEVAVAGVEPQAEQVMKSRLINNKNAMSFDAFIFINYVGFGFKSDPVWRIQPRSQTNFDSIDVNCV